jgi:hypothetical protein
MKLICFILGFGLWLRAVPVSGQANQVESSRGVLQHDPASPMDDKTNSTAPSHEKLTEEDSKAGAFSPETWLEDQRALWAEYKRVLPDNVTNLPDMTNIAAFSLCFEYYDPERPPATPTNVSRRPIFYRLDKLRQPDVTFIVHTPEPCPARYTNVISNTNLISPDERDLFQRIWDKYDKLKTHTSGQERVRSKSGDGYDAEYTPGAEWKVYQTTEGSPEPPFFAGMKSRKSWLLIQEVKHDQLNGVRVEIYGGQLANLLHFKNDMAVGDWFDWGTNGTLRLQARFNKPYYLFENTLPSEDITGVKP